MLSCCVPTYFIYYNFIHIKVIKKNCWAIYCILIMKYSNSHILFIFLGSHGNLISGFVGRKKSTVCIKCWVRKKTIQVLEKNILRTNNKLRFSISCHFYFIFFFKNLIQWLLGCILLGF